VTVCCSDWRQFWYLLCCTVVSQIVTLRQCPYPECTTAIVLLSSQFVSVIRLCVGQFIIWRSLEHASLMMHPVHKHAVNCGTVSCRCVFFLLVLVQRSAWKGSPPKWPVIMCGLEWDVPLWLTNWSVCMVCGLCVCACCVVYIQDGAEKLFIVASRQHHRHQNPHLTSIISLLATWNL